MSSSGPNCSFFLTPVIHWEIRVWMGVCSFSLPGLCGIWNQSILMFSSVSDVFRRPFISWTASLWLFFRKCRAEKGFTSLINSVCSGVSIEKFAICIPFLSVYGRSRKWLNWNLCLLFCVVKIRQIRRFSSFSRSGEDWIVLVASWSVWICDFWQGVVHLFCCFIVSTGFSMGSFTFVNIGPSCFNCSGRGKFRVPWCKSSIVMLRCRNKRPIKELVRFVKTINFSGNVVSMTSICISLLQLVLLIVHWKQFGTQVKGLHLIMRVELVSEFCANRPQE